MSLESKKLELVESILSVSSMEVLESLQSIIDDQKSGIIGYTIKGRPLNKKEYEDQIKSAEQGKYLSHDDLKEAVDQW